MKHLASATLAAAFVALATAAAEMIPHTQIKDPDRIPRELTVSTAYGNIEATIVERLFVAPGSGRLAGAQLARLDELAAEFAEFYHTRIMIIGHSDGVGTRKDNKALSHKRAQIVRYALFVRGLHVNRMIEVGEGERKPLANNAAAEGRRMNRRRDIYTFIPKF